MTGQTGTGTGTGTGTETETGTDTGTETQNFFRYVKFPVIPVRVDQSTLTQTAAAACRYEIDILHEKENDVFYIGLFVAF